jgi:hypothetical protein
MTTPASPTSASVTALSMAAVGTFISTRRRARNFLPSRDLPAISRTKDTQYQNGIDFHIDWGTSMFLSKQVFVGLVGYLYQQVTDDFGQNPILGGFRSRVVSIGPQIGYLFPVGDMQGYLNLKGYGEFDASNRPSGWNTWVTFSISPMAPTSTVAPTRRMVTK